MSHIMEQQVVAAMQALAEKMHLNEYSRRETVFEQSKTKDEIDRVIYNHSISHQELSDVCGMSINTMKDKYAQALAQGIVEPVIKVANKWKYTLDHTHKLMDWLQIPSWKDKHSFCHVINVQNQKGGTGKSTTTLSLACELALDLNERLRICVIDLDPQGSLRNLVAADAIDESFDILTAVDLMVGAQEPESAYHYLQEQNMDHEDILKLSLLETHLPNLKVLPSYPSDERFSSLAWFSYSKTNQMDAFVPLLKQKVIDPLKKDFDIIFIDTGPHINPLTWSALYASNGLLVPITPKKLDWMSTQQFIESLPDQLNHLPEGKSPLLWFKAIATNYDDENYRDKPILDELKDVLGRHLFNPCIKRSSAFEVASRQYRTVVDIMPSEKLCPARQLSKAVDSVKDAARELLLHLIDIDMQHKDLSTNHHKEYETREACRELL
jgi:chromosome partitioning protein